MEEQVIALAGMTGCSCKLHDLLLACYTSHPLPFRTDPSPLLPFRIPPSSISNYLSLTKTSCLLCIINTYHLEKWKEEQSLLLGSSL